MRIDLMTIYPNLSDAMNRVATILPYEIIRDESRLYHLSP